MCLFGASKLSFVCFESVNGSLKCFRSVWAEFVRSIILLIQFKA